MLKGENKAFPPLTIPCFVARSNFAKTAISNAVTIYWFNLKVRLNDGVRSNLSARPSSLREVVFTTKQSSVFNELTLLWIASSQTAFLAMTMSQIYGLRQYMTNPCIVVARSVFYDRSNSGNINF